MVEGLKKLAELHEELNFKKAAVNYKRAADRMVKLVIQLKKNIKKAWAVQYTDNKLYEYCEARNWLLRTPLQSYGVPPISRRWGD